jgi:enterochelin esterase-like enzyme
MGCLSRLRGIPFLAASLILCGCRSEYPFEKIPLARGQMEVAHVSETANLTVERIRFWSDQLSEPRFFLALIPKAPSTHAEAFILNHGWWDRPEDLLTYLKVDQVYDGMLARGEVRPAIVVIPDVRFKNFYRVDSRRVAFPNYLRLIAEEVAGVVSQQYKIPFERDRWSIGGFSFGGYLSLDVGRRYPGRFASVSIVSGLVDPQWSFWPADAPRSDTGDAGDKSRDTVVVPGPIPRLFLACGTDDYRQFGPMQQLHNTLLGLGIPHIWSTGPGGHTWEYWASVLQEMFKFHLGFGQSVKSP